MRARVLACHGRTVRVPSVGVRRHRITLTDRPSIVRIERPVAPAVVGESVDRFAEHPHRWMLGSILFVLLFVLGCARAASW
jgi:hypothetical protein